MRIAICGRDGEVRWHDIWEGNPILVRPDDVIRLVAQGQQISRVTNGPGARPYIVYPFSEQTGWTFNQSFKCREHIARIYLSIDERQRGAAARAKYGPYVLIEPYTKHGNFLWPLDRWEQLVGACPDLTFVQHTHHDSTEIMGARLEPATFREACGLAAHAALYVRSESGMCHAAAAFSTPQVTLFGGCMDAEVMGGYPGQTCVVDRGPGSPCGKWLPCDHCRDCMARISVEDVAAAIRARLAERMAA